MTFGLYVLSTVKPASSSLQLKKVFTSASHRIPLAAPCSLLRYNGERLTVMTVSVHFSMTVSVQFNLTVRVHFSMTVSVYFSVTQNPSDSIMQPATRQCGEAYCDD